MQIKKLSIRLQFEFCKLGSLFVFQIEEKIAKYIATKQNDNNEINIREFCGMQSGDSSGNGDLSKSEIYDTDFFLQLEP